VTFFHSAAPGIGRESNRVTVDVDIGQNASGVLYALGGVAGGLALYMDKGHLVYEYNMMMIERYIGHSAEALAPGKHQIDIDTSVAKMAGPANVVIAVDGHEVLRVDVKRTVAGAFSASETLDFGVDLGSPVSLDYFDRRPFRLTCLEQKRSIRSRHSSTATVARNRKQPSASQ
jgi:hypothetical protein